MRKKRRIKFAIPIASKLAYVQAGGSKVGDAVGDGTADIFH